MKKKDKIIIDELTEIEPALTPEQLEIKSLKAQVNALLLVNATLLEIKDHFEQDAMYSVYFANNRKANQFAQMINNLDISKPAELDTYVKLTSKQPAIMEILNKMRKEFLKLDEEELAKVEERGIPLIEQQGKKQK